MSRIEEGIFIFSYRTIQQAFRTELILSLSSS